MIILDIMSRAEGDMAHFIVRVELHQPYTSDTYQRLHEIMRAASFFRLIQSSDSRFYHLPEAEYSHYDSSGATPFQIVDLVWPLVARVHSSYEILVSQADSWAARGLRPT